MIRQTQNVLIDQSGVVPSICRVGNAHSLNISQSGKAPRRTTNAPYMSIREQKYVSNWGDKFDLFQQRGMGIVLLGANQLQQSLTLLLCAVLKKCKQNGFVLRSFVWNTWCGKEKAQGELDESQALFQNDSCGKWCWHHWKWSCLWQTKGQRILSSPFRMLSKEMYPGSWMPSMQVMWNGCRLTVQGKIKSFHCKYHYDIGQHKVIDKWEWISCSSLNIHMWFVFAM